MAGTSPPLGRCSLSSCPVVSASKPESQLLDLCTLTVSEISWWVSRVFLRTGVRLIVRQNRLCGEEYDNHLAFTHRKYNKSCLCVGIAAERNE